MNNKPNSSNQPARNQDHSSKGQPILPRPATDGATTGIDAGIAKGYEESLPKQESMPKQESTPKQESMPKKDSKDGSITPDQTAGLSKPAQRTGTPEQEKRDTKQPGSTDDTTDAKKNVATVHTKVTKDAPVRG